MSKTSEQKYSVQLNVDKPNLNLIDDESFLEEILKSRNKDFGRILNDVLSGTPVSAFGPKGNGLWGGSDDKKDFTIKGFKFEGTQVFQNHQKDESYRRNNPEVYAHARVTLNGYKAKENGLIYTDEVFEKQMQKVFKGLGFKAEIFYTEQGMQGEKDVSMALIFPMDVIAPDVSDFLKAKYKQEYKDSKVVKDVKKKKRGLSM